ncbi:MAG: hypothetical protein OEZ10_04400 [Gammaproteobacteria bacterium]|nr:hypothetical protein [Gammaproteobacteria bacterium]
MNKSDQNFLFSLLSQPTAPFREQFVSAVARDFLDRYHLPYFLDPAGNIVIGVNSVAGYKKLLKDATDEPVRMFMAHMDHPGYHGVKWIDDRRLKVKWHGGTPTRHVAGAEVYCAGNDGRIGSGRLAGVTLVKGGWAMDSAEIVFKQPLSPRPPATELFGSFRFRKPVWLQGKRIYTNAADDLAGVFTVLRLARKLSRLKGSAPFIGLLTRGEEVGFVGAINHFELGWFERYRNKLLCVSLEASRTLPGAVVGKGPIVRLGDRRTVFNADALKVATDVAEKLLPNRYQKRIMDGGACEATAATIYGLTTIGITVPLGNYHNQGFEGGPDCRGKAGPAPEFIHIDDLESELLLCAGLMRRGLPWLQPWQKQKKSLLRNAARYRRLA